MRKKSLFASILACLSLTLCACHEPKADFEAWDASFTNCRQLVSEPLLHEELILGLPIAFKYADSSLFISDYLTDSLFVLIDLKDNNRIYRFGRKGQGSNEFIQPLGCCLMPADSLVGIYDCPRKQLRAINLRQAKRGVFDFPVCWRDTLSSIEVYPTSHGTYLGKGFYEHNMLSLTGDSIGRRYFFEYPYRDSREQDISNRLRGMAYQGAFCSNPSLDRWVFAVGCSPILMFFSVDKTEVKKTYEWIGGYPEYQTEVTEQYISAPMSADNVQFCVDVSATDRFVYLLYSGKTFREAGEKSMEGTTVYRLTWDGIPVDKLELDYPSKRICVSPDDGMLYSMASKGEIEIVEYRL